MHLKVVTGESAGSVVPLRREGAITLGREASSTLVVEDPKASRRHCAIEWAGDGWRLRDLGSANGTWVNGDRVVERRLEPGDLVQIGATVLQLAGEEEPAAAPGGAGIPPTAVRQSPRQTAPPGEPEEERRAGRRPRARPAGLGPLIFAVIVLAAAAPVVIHRLGSQAGTAAHAPLESEKITARRTPQAEPAPPGGAGEGLAAAERPFSDLVPGSSVPQIARPSPLLPVRGSELEPSAGEAHWPRPELEEKLRACRLALARLDLGTAKRLLAELPPHAPGLPRRPGEELEPALRALEALEAAVQAQVRSGAPSSLELIPGRSLPRLELGGAHRAGEAEARGRLPATGSYRLLELKGAYLRLERADGKEEVRDLLSLSDASLSELAAGAIEREEAGLRALREGLLVLLLLREGPARAERFAAAGAETDRFRDFLASLGSEAADFWLAARREELEARVRRLEEEGEAAAAEWNEVAVRHIELIRLQRERLADRGGTEDLERRFIEARIQALRRQPGSLFRAATAQAESGRLRLRYDFGAASQLEDFTVVGKESTLRWARSGMALRGECRFQSGNPFRGRLSVKVEVPAGAYAPDAPNINLALWTREDDVVTPSGSMSLTRAFLDDHGAPADYLVFAAGYRAVVADFGGRPLEQVRPAGSREFLDLPAHCLFAGAARRPLHRDGGECLWARKLTGALRGAIISAAECGLESCSWTLNGQSLLPAEVAAGGRVLSRSPRRGSFSLLTNGREVRFAAIEVEGELDPRWLEPRLRKQAERELGEHAGE
jgi:hypothetical protein